jgi:hypothetical protein
MYFDDYAVSGWIKERESDRQREALAALDDAEEFSSFTEEFLDPELVIMHPA